MDTASPTSAIASQNAATSAPGSSVGSSASAPVLLPLASSSSSPPHAPRARTPAVPTAIARHVQLFRNVPPTVCLLSIVGIGVVERGRPRVYLPALVQPVVATGGSGLHPERVEDGIPPGGVLGRGLRGGHLY